MDASSYSQSLPVTPEDAKWKCDRARPTWLPPWPGQAWDQMGSNVVGSVISEATGLAAIYDRCSLERRPLFTVLRLRRRPPGLDMTEREIAMTTLDHQFNLRKRHPSGKYYMLLNTIESMFAARRLPCSLDVSYGNSPGQQVDVFPAKSPSSPVFVFIHGGYFRALDKSQYRYIAPRLRKAGYATVLVNYDLAPQVSVTEIVRQVLDAFSWTCRHIERWNGDSNQLVLCGHSVGAFLAAKILEEDWDDEHPTCQIKKAILLSGLYDLGPMKQSYLDRDLRLTTSEVETLSPMACFLKQAPDILIAAGEDETEEFVRQSVEYAAKLRRDSIENELVIMPGLHHYSMARTLAQKRNTVIDRISSGPSQATWP